MGRALRRSHPNREPSASLPVALAAILTSAQRTACRERPAGNAAAPRGGERPPMAAQRGRMRQSRRPGVGGACSEGAVTGAGRGLSGAPRCGFKERGGKKRNYFSYTATALPAEQQAGGRPVTPSQTFLLQAFPSSSQKALGVRQGCCPSPAVLLALA